MATPDRPLDGDRLLTAVADAMSDLHERHYHRPPGSAQCRLMGDDRLACRSVTHFISAHSVGPDLEIEPFFLGDALAVRPGG